MSHVEKKLGAAKQEACGLGHAPRTAGFRYGLGLLGCEHCDCTGTVTLDAGFAGYMNGGLFALACRNGGAELVPPPPAPAPTTGRAKRIPQVAPVSVAQPALAGVR